MLVKVLKAWRGYKAGHVFTEMPDGVAELLARRGIVEIMDESARGVRQPVASFGGTSPETATKPKPQAKPRRKPRKKKPPA